MADAEHDAWLHSVRREARRIAEEESQLATPRRSLWHEKTSETEVQSYRTGKVFRKSPSDVSDASVAFRLRAVYDDCIVQGDTEASIEVMGELFATNVGVANFFHVSDSAWAMGGVQAWLQGELGLGKYKHYVAWEEFKRFYEKRLKKGQRGQQESREDEPTIDVSKRASQSSEDDLLGLAPDFLGDYKYSLVECFRRCLRGKQIGEVSKQSLVKELFEVCEGDIDFAAFFGLRPQETATQKLNRLERFISLDDRTRITWAELMEVCDVRVGFVERVFPKSKQEEEELEELPEQDAPLPHREPIDPKLERARLMDIFRYCDYKRDSSITKQELLKACRETSRVAEFLHIGDTIEDMKDAFAEMDTNSDKNVTWQEFQAWYYARVKKLRAVKAEDASGSEQQDEKKAQDEDQQLVMAKRAAARGALMDLFMELDQGDGESDSTIGFAQLRFKCETNSKAARLLGLPDPLSGGRKDQVLLEESLVHLASHVKDVKAVTWQEFQQIPRRSRDFLIEFERAEEMRAVDEELKQKRVEEVLKSMPSDDLKRVMMQEGRLTELRALSRNHKQCFNCDIRVVDLQSILAAHRRLVALVAASSNFPNVARWAMRSPGLPQFGHQPEGVEMLALAEDRSLDSEQLLAEITKVVGEISFFRSELAELYSLLSMATGTNISGSKLPDYILQQSTLPAELTLLNSRTRGLPHPSGESQSQPRRSSSRSLA
eukprot:TRINITY_DN20485_c0_g1_i1.p1 TRINITY_DN20485_c0_g1~~TRINITY_DN20485_c0_g1_i1.p1  ORF type:complete len:718 (+),score=162.21 TRINITY_DN20485_c0_g1_i1:87-2240(+)